MFSRFKTSMTLFHKSEDFKFNKSPNEAITALGCMSGTSLDGLDLALVTFTPPSNKNSFWKFHVQSTEFISYSKTGWEEKLLTAYTLSNKNKVEEISKNYAQWISLKAKNFLDRLPKNIPQAEIFCCHGHTVRHNPKMRVTKQIGNTYELTTHLDIPVVCDFRSADVKRGGQGAPLVPLADMFLFHEYPICLNLGGFANASWDNNGIRYATDLAPCNIILNELTKKIGKSYDENGKLAAQGNVKKKELNKLNNLSYYNSSIPKSLSWEWAMRHAYPILFEIPIIEDALATAVEHCAWAINKGIKEINAKKIFVTGGGVWNSHLLKRIAHYFEGEIFVPKKEIVDQKEAICFAFLGIKKLRGEVNVLSSVTGGSIDSSDGIMFVKKVVQK